MKRRRELDCVTIEHNGLLCDPAMAGKVVERVALALQKRSDWDEWVLSGVDRSIAKAHYEDIATRLGWIVHAFGERPWYVVRLNQLRGGDNQLDWLSVNTATRCGARSRNTASAATSRSNRAVRR